MKRLLAISWEMPPLSGPRAVQVTRTLVELGKRGWESRVVCFGARSDRYQQDFHVAPEVLAAAHVTLLPVQSPEERFWFRALWRVCPPLKRFPDEKRVWMPAALREARPQVAASKADVIVSFAQPWTDHLVGLRLHRETGLPWVAHFSDPWIDNPYQPGAAWQRRVLARMEHEVIEAATRLVFVNRFTRDRVMQKYPADWASRAHVVPQGFEDEPVHTSQRSPDGSPMRIVYTGRFYNGRRTPGSLFRALEQIRQRQPLEGLLHVTFVGGHMRTYQQEASARELDGVVRFTGRLSPPEARRQAAEADVLLAIDAPSDGANLFLGSKVIDYLPLRKPILALTPKEGATAELISRLQYPVVDPGDVAGATRAIESLLANHRAGTLGPSAHHDDVAREYRIAETTTRFDEVLKAACERT